MRGWLAGRTPHLCQGPMQAPQLRELLYHQGIILLTGVLLVRAKGIAAHGVVKPQAQPRLFHAGHKGAHHVSGVWRVAHRVGVGGAIDCCIAGPGCKAAAVLGHVDEALAAHGQPRRHPGVSVQGGGVPQGNVGRRAPATAPLRPCHGGHVPVVNCARWGACG